MQREMVRAVFTEFEDLSDPRREHLRLYDLYEIVVMALCASLAGCDNWADVWRFAKAKYLFFRRFLRLANGIPSDDTFRRVFHTLDTPEFLVCVRNWMHRFSPKEAGHIALDGKTLCGSGNEQRSPLQRVSAWGVRNRLVLGQAVVPEGSNEITAMKELLGLMDLDGATVTIDALGCQHEIVETIRDRGADFLVSVKGNQPTLQEKVQNHFEQLLLQKRAKELREHRVVQMEHGKEVARTYLTAPAPPSIRRQWPDARTIGMVVTTRHKSETDDEEGSVRCYLSSLGNRVRRFAKRVRDHWTVENQLHWSLDVTVAEDRHRMRKDQGPHNCAILRRLSLSLLQLDTSISDNLRGKRRLASFDDEVLLKLLTGFHGRK